MNYKVCCLIITVIFLLVPEDIFAKEFIPNGPLISRTQNPIYLQSLGQKPSRAEVLPKGRFSTWLGMDYSNMFELGLANGGADEVKLDMELARLGFNVEYGIGRDMQFSVELPFLHFNGGYFDKFIQDFHNAFGFPNGGREHFPNGAFAYKVTKDNQVIYNVKRQAIGLSDIILGFQYNFLRESDFAPGVASVFRLKLPTGKPSSGLGDGNINYSLGFVVEKSIKRWHFYLNADYIVAPGHEGLDELYVGEIFAWLTAVEFSVSTPISLILQLQGSTPLLNGIQTSKWDGVPCDIVIGVKGTHKNLFWGNDFFWQWSFSEDIYPEGTSVDITTMLVLGVRFDM